MFAPSTKRGLGLRIAAAAVMLAGIGLICYPFVSDALNQQAQNAVSATQQQSVATMEPEDLSAHAEAARAYNEGLTTGGSQVVDPFDDSAEQPGSEEYEQLLDLAGDGVMGEIVIPSIKVHLPIYHYAEGDALSHGVGHVFNTSLPIGGPSTHCVLAGHTGLPAARLFDRLDELETGSFFVVRVLGEDHAYRVYSTEVVLPDDVSSLSIEPGRDLMTLVTCTPYGSNTHRLLVHAERCGLPEGWGESKGIPDPASSVRNLHSQNWLYALAGALVGGLGIAAGFLVRAYRVRKSRRERHSFTRHRF